MTYTHAEVLAVAVSFVQVRLLMLDLVLVVVRALTRVLVHARARVQNIMPDAVLTVVLV